MPSAVAQEKLAARARRIRLLRRRIVAAVARHLRPRLGRRRLRRLDGRRDHDRRVDVDDHAATTTTSTDTTSTSTDASTLVVVRRLRGHDDHEPVMSEHAFWITSRAAGIIALLAASLAVALGLRWPPRARTRRVVHESLSLATMVALAVHAFSLLGDSYLKPSLADVTIPFVSQLRAAVDERRDRRRLGVRDPRPLLLRPRPHRHRSAGARCTASPRWRGCSASSTR